MDRKTFSLLHRRLGHPCANRIRHLLKEAEITEVKFFCESCVKGKAHRQPIGNGPAPRSNKILHRIHSDICEMNINTRDGKRYILTFIDDCSRFAVIYLLKKKSEALQCFKNYLAFHGHRGKIHLLHTDQGGEDLSKEFKAYCDSKGIVQETTPSHTR
jgi:transposase InsO family protein